VKLAWANTRASGIGPSQVQADAECLARAGRSLMETLAAPLAAALTRPVIASHPFTIVVEGKIHWEDYRRLLGVLKREIPEISRLEERRFSHGRQTLRATCACEPWDVAQRLDGRVTSGFALQAESELTLVRVQVKEPGGAGPAP
jgi:hypothetical protein